MIKRKVLLNWYIKNKRRLPWRQIEKKQVCKRAKKDLGDQQRITQKTNPYLLAPNPYKIWISEIMLQQTTAVAVIPYYQRFFKKFPSLRVLAQADVGDVLVAWSGLGYYSRARNIHKTAQIIQDQYNGIFPKTWQELIKLPGIGPYTARAIASFAFGQQVGVLDGNVIRFLSRYHLMRGPWWTTKGRASFQSLADLWAKGDFVSDLNQALIEIGAEVCLPQKPLCSSCPVKHTCQAYLQQMQAFLPLSRPRQRLEPWLYRPLFYYQKGKYLMIEHKGPFLKGQWLWPGQIQKLKYPPVQFDFKHTITHHNIHVQMSNGHCKSHQLPVGWEDQPHQWVKKSQVKMHNPSSLISKTLNTGFFIR